MPEKIPDVLFAEIKTLCCTADDLFEEDEYELAMESYRAAWKLVPEPSEDYEASTWLLVSIGECHFAVGRFERASNSFFSALQCPGGLGDPYIHLRLGAAYYEFGDKKRANDELVRAYMGGGDELFENEEEKYLSFIRDQVQ